MSETLAFAARLLSHHGALVDGGAGGLEAVVPVGLGKRLDVPEHVVLSEAAASPAGRLAYGSALLERMVDLATASVPVASARLTGLSMRENLALDAAERFALRNGVFAVGGAKAETALRLWVHAAYVLHGDERREGLSTAVVSVRSGTLVEGFEQAAAGRLEPEGAGDLAIGDAGRAVLTAMRACAAEAERAATPFRESLERRIERDRERLESYFADLLTELDRRAARGRLAPEAVEDRRLAIHRDRSSKLEALAGRKQLRVELRPVAAVVVEAPAVVFEVEVRRRKLDRVIEIEIDAATRRLVPPPCAGCGGPAPRPAACDDAVHLLCESCAPRSEGRVACPVCRRR